MNEAKLLNNESSNETIFDNKWLLFASNNFKSTRKEPHNFCMCLSYCIDISSNDNAGTSNLRTRRSSKRRK